MKIIFSPQKIVLDYHVGGLIEVQFATWCCCSLKNTSFIHVLVHKMYIPSSFGVNRVHRRIEI